MVTCAIHSAPIPAGGRPPHAHVRRRQCHFAGVECSRALRACDSESVTFTEVIELVGEAIDGAGVAIIVAGVIAATIAAVSRLVRHEPGVYLRYRQQLGRSILHLYANWLPGSGESPRDFPLFMQRVKFFPDVADSEAVTDIYLPLT